MTNLLLRLFAPESGGDEAARRWKIGQLSGIVGIVCNILLFLVKLAIGALTGAVSVTADAMNNLTDASGSVVTLLGFRLAEKPADEHHPYGHARLEYLSGLAVAVMVLFVGVELAKSSVAKILAPEPVRFSLAAGAALAAAVGMKLWLWLFNRKLGRGIRSDALLATAADSRNDALSTGAVLVAMALEHWLNWRVDGIFGLAVAVFILVSGWGMARSTVSTLLGEAADPELRRKIVDYISDNPLVLGYHDLMVHDYGPGQRFASVHVEMDRGVDPLICHEAIDDMERECFASHGVRLVIHYDPVVTDDPELDRLRRLVGDMVKIRDPRLSIHDFRMVPGQKHTNLVFDVALPHDLRGQETAIRDALEAALNRLGEKTYHTVITFDLGAHMETE